MYVKPTFARCVTRPCAAFAWLLSESQARGAPPWLIRCVATPTGRNFRATRPVLVLDLDNASQANAADLIILMLDSRKTDSTREQEMVRLWHNAGKRVLVFINQFDVPHERMAVSPWANRGHQRVVWGSPLDSRFMLEQFAPRL